MVAFRGRLCYVPVTMKSKSLAVWVMLLATALGARAADMGGIGLYVWSADPETGIAEKTRMRLIVERSSGEPILVLRDFAKGTSLRTIVAELVGELRGRGFSANQTLTPQGRSLVTVTGARALRVSYSPSTVSTELADIRGLEDSPTLLAQDGVASR